MAIDDIHEDDEQTLMLFPPGTVFFEPDRIHQVTIQFPDADSAVVFFEWCRQIIINTEKRSR
jgi:hypothetical protein